MFRHRTNLTRVAALTAGLALLLGPSVARAGGGGGDTDGLSIVSEIGRAHV